jgi:C4-dicarboxylate-specific signal transduction histidine kinase
MSSETSDHKPPDDVESKMLRSLGLGTASNTASVLSSPIDPLKAARQAIRSQAVAREYAERQLAHAEVTIQDLRTKLHHARQEKDAAVEATGAATAMRITAQRTLIATEAALADEKAARNRDDRALREAQATVRDLQGRLDAATQGLERAKAELTAERQARQQTEEALRDATSIHQSPEPIVAPEVAELGQSSTSAAITKRPRGRPVHATHAVRPRKEPVRPANTSQAAGSTERDQSTNSTMRRPVGRPRKAIEVPSLPTSNEPAGQAEVQTKTANRKAAPPKGEGHNRSAGGQEPVQWWIEGWNR